MNPKSVNDLDPKLREAYERVMGSNFTPKSSSQAQNTPAEPGQPQQNPQPAAPTPSPEPNTPLMQTAQVFTQNPVPSEPTPQQPEPAKQETQSPPSDPTSIFTQSPSTAPVSQKKKLNMLPVLFAIGAVVFFGAYVIIWAKVFGLF